MRFFANSSLIAALCSLFFSVHGGAEVLTLQRAIDLARNNSPSIKKQQAAYEGQSNRVVSAWLDTGPRGKVVYNWTQFQNNQEIPFGPSSLVMRPQNTSAGSFTLSQPLTSFYALMENARLEGLKKDMAQNSVQLAATYTAFAIVELYIRNQQMSALYMSSKDRIEAGESIQKEGAALLLAGKIHKGDSLKLDLVLSEAKSSAAKIKAQLDILQATLKEHTGYQDGQAFTLPSIESVPMPPVPEEKAAIERALAHRPELQQAKTGVEVSAFAWKLAAVGYTPQVNAFVQWNRNYGDLPFGQERNTKIYGIAATWDIWDNGSRVFKMREAAELKVQATYEVEELQRKIKLEVLETEANLRAAAETVTLAKLALAQATEAHRIESSRFREGSSRTSELVLSEAAKAYAKNHPITTGVVKAAGRAAGIGAGVHIIP